VWNVREHNRGRLVLAAGALAWSACAGGRASPAPTAAALAPLAQALRADVPARAPEALLVRLAFGAASDLDLYVSDPFEETVYFANTPSRAGGALDADRTCDEPGSAVRVETVVFERAPPGRYRIGVDHPRSCDGSNDPAAFALEVVHDGGSERRSGAVPHRIFEPIVLELNLR
jgi:hypothetical protein